MTVAGQAGTIVLLGGIGALYVGALAVRELIGTGLEYDATSRDLRTLRTRSGPAADNGAYEF